MTDADLSAFLPGQALVALQRVRAHAAFAPHAARIRSELRQPLIGVAVGRRANAEALVKAFSDRRRATRLFGEPLAPLDTESTPPHPREQLLELLQARIDGCRAGAIVCLLGNEGVGKSWLVAQGWLTSLTKPLLVVLSPTDLGFPMTPDDFEVLLARRMAAQACDRSADGARDTWQEFLRRWRRTTATDRGGLLVVIDGINQRPDKDWPRILDYVANELRELGGHLVVTTRTAYYELHVRPRLPDPVEELQIPEWTEAERDSILSGHAVELGALRGAHDVDSRVADALCNPRLLGIALRLLRGRSVAHIGELSISHLLFEHIRVTERENRTPEPVHETVQRLRAHATHILERVQSGRIADAAVFDSVEQIADGRFWVPLENDRTRYRLADDAMILALGFTVVDRLRAARRQTQTLVAVLDTLLEPILALDDTARAISAALTCACLDGTTTDDIRSALVYGFVHLQNPSVDNLAPTAALARVHPSPFMDAARRLCLDGWNQPNVDWLEHALLGAITTGTARHDVERELRQWLSLYATGKEEGGEAPADAGTADSNRSATPSAALGVGEVEILARMQPTCGDLDELARLAFVLLSRRPRRPFVKEIVSWSVGYMVHMTNLLAYQTLGHLLTFNTIDWYETRSELLRELTVLRRSDTSSTGRWALVMLLDATGHVDDAAQAETQRRALSSRRARNWRLVEDYCASDPCNPRSRRPTNMAATVQRYRDLDVATVRGQPFATAQDHFFEEARLGVARFALPIAVAKHRQLADNVVEREGRAFRLGILALLPHTALLRRRTVKRVVEYAGAAAAADSESGEEPGDGHRWAFAQRRLLVAFPHLSGNAQVSALLATVKHSDVLRSLLKVMNPIDRRLLEDHLRKVSRREALGNLYALLVYARSSGSR
ncbi:MAG: hypothetical protein OXH69_20775 [Acidobacteria bacterium]|nr:hypothetical protein [Acidobacteriota bacterium]